MSLLVLAVTLVSAQTPVPAPQQTPVFRSGTTVVPLTVTVLDEKGVPVRDLTAADFTVYENGKSREIVNFFPQEMRPQLPGVAPVGGVPQARSAGLTPQTGRTFLIVLGNDNIFKMLESAADFVRNSLLPQDAVAIMAFHRVTPLTLDHDAIAKIVERFKASNDTLRFNYWLSNEKSLSGNKGRPNQTEVVKKMDAVLAGAGPVRNTADLLFGMDLPQVVENPWQHRASVDELLDRLHGRSLTDLVIASPQIKLFAGIEYLRYIDGEKHILFLSGGGLARDADSAVMVGQRAADARVVVDMITNSGFEWSSRDVVNLTGGYYTSLEWPKTAFARLDTATRFSYLLGYTPFNPDLDGRYRTVNVKVNRPGVTVRFEHGYFANAEPDPIELKTLLVKARIDALLAYDSQATDIPLKVAAFILPRMGIQLEARVEIVIDATKIEFESQTGRHMGKLEVQVYCGDAKQAVVGELGEHLDLEAADDTFAAWQQMGIRRVLRVPVSDPPKYVKVVVYDHGSQRAGSYMLTMK